MADQSKGNMEQPNSVASSENNMVLLMNDIKELQQCVLDLKEMQKLTDSPQNINRIASLVMKHAGVKHSPSAAFGNDTEKIGRSGSIMMTRNTNDIHSVPNLDMQQDVKRQQLLINQLTSRVNELETKLLESQKRISDNEGDIADLKSVLDRVDKEHHKALDIVTSEISEKIAKQRLELQKVTDGKPEPVNYDPFNYGEAYNGDTIDFQARKRITELKFFLNTLNETVTTLKHSVTPLQEIDMDYQVVRMADILQHTGFDKIAKEEMGKTFEESVVSYGTKQGTKPSKQVLLVSQTSKRDPAKVYLPRSETYVRDEPKFDKEENTKATSNSMMQTMYRLEIELGELQRAVASTEITSVVKTLEEIKTDMFSLKDDKMDKDTAMALIDELRQKCANATQKVKPSVDDGSRSMTSVGSMDKAAYEMVNQKIENLTNYTTVTIDAMQKRIKNLEGHDESKDGAGANYGYMHGEKKRCLSCERPVSSQGKERQLGHNLPYLASMPRTDGDVAKLRLRQKMTRTHGVVLPLTTINKIPPIAKAETKQVAELPPLYQGELTHPREFPKFSAVNCPIKGTDGRLYLADPQIDKSNWIMDMKARRQEFLDQMRLKEIENRQNFTGLDHEKMFADIKKRETRMIKDPRTMTSEKGKRSRALSKVASSEHFVRPVNKKEEFDMIINYSDRLVVFEFSAEWCAACQDISPKVAKLVQTYPQVVFYSINADINHAIVEEAEITKLPTFLIYLYGNLVSRMEGPSISELDSMIANWQVTSRCSLNCLDKPSIYLRACSPAPSSPPLMSYEKDYMEEQVDRVMSTKPLAQAKRDQEEAGDIMISGRGLISSENLKENQIKVRASSNTSMRKENEAAMKIQAGMKGMLARKSIKKQKEVENLAAIKIQASLKGMLTRRSLKIQQAEENLAASKIQAGMKGMMTRRSLKRQLEEKDVAATKIQAGLKGMMIRKQLKRENERPSKQTLSTQDGTSGGGSKKTSRQNSYLQLGPSASKRPSRQTSHVQVGRSGSKRPSRLNLSQQEGTSVKKRTSSKNLNQQEGTSADKQVSNTSVTSAASSSPKELIVIKNYNDIAVHDSKTEAVRPDPIAAEEYMRHIYGTPPTNDDTHATKKKKVFRERHQSDTGTPDTPAKSPKDVKSKTSGMTFSPKKTQSATANRKGSATFTVKDSKGAAVSQSMLRLT